MTDDGSTEALFRRANQLLAAGNIPDAILAHERLLARRPDLADSWYNLGYLHRCARRFEDALAAYGEALDRGVAQPEEVRLNRAAILSDHLQRGEAALAELEEALRVDPGFLPAWLNLGTLHEDWGDPARARDAYRRALAIDPSNARALARLTTIDLFRGEAASAVDRLAAALRALGRPAEDRAELGFALGAALDVAGRYDEAFAAFARANADARATAPRYHRAGHQALVDALVALPPVHAPADRAADLPADAPRPIFVCGMFRSGSTLAEQVLARHPRVTAGGELDAIPAMVRDRLRPYPQALAAAPPALLRTLRDGYLGELRALFPGADLVTDKRVDNVLHIGLIKALFPAARIVHTFRNPLDNILSVYFLHFGTAVPYGFDLDDIVHWYGQYRRLIAHWRRLYPGDIVDFSYDGFVADPEPTLRRALDACGLDWDPRCLDPGDARAAVRTASAWQVRQPLHTRSSGRWRRYERHLDAVRAALDRIDQSRG